MTRTIWTGTFGAIVGAATVAALAQTPAPQQSTGSTDNHRITVTGCLKPAPPEATDSGAASGATGTTGSATAGPSAASAQKFVLTNATMTPASDNTETTPPPGSRSSAGGQASASADQALAAGAPAQTYRLIANAAALSPHVGKKLELTGTVEPQQPGSATTGGSQDATSTLPALRVEAGKVIAASCQD